MRPEPTSPPRPTTSPARTCRLTPRTAGPPRANLEQHAVGADRALGIELLHLPADHELDELLGRGRRRQARGRGAAVGEDGHGRRCAGSRRGGARCRRRRPLGGEPADDLEERADLGVVEDRGRLVHDQQPHVAGQRARDRRSAARPAAASPPSRARGSSRARAGRAAPRTLGTSCRGRAAARAEARARGRCSRRRSGRDEVELLVDRRDAALQRSAGSPVGSGSPGTGSRRSSARRRRRRT